MAEEVPRMSLQFSGQGARLGLSADIGSRDYVG